LGLAPVVAPHTRLLVLGSFPSAASLTAGQYYAHPRNHFWTILSSLWQIDLRALPYARRLDEVRRRGLGVWDVYASCRREGSLDSAIEEAAPNDLAGLIATLPHLRVVAHNGSESARSMALTRALLSRSGSAGLLNPLGGRRRQRLGALSADVVRLPSSSPANASWSLARKCEAWRAVFAQHGLCA
jgi:hypoxanthine-DNA glycosylase